ncbi:MAG TPA: class IV adenylate cyclase [Candidatus Binataceae bacterium]|jgi:predicted adenylyl cyclase CyaB|nr:class IV adenylate cyclase [Candidatus Binataceae bacterium]
MENIEIKARCRDAAAMARAVAAAGALWEATLSQVDTYFNVQTGRLKLRQTDDGARELIFYRRANEHAPKLSRYDRMPIVPGQTLDLLLTQALGVKTIVRKRRQLWRLDNIRIHLDEVDGLGTFIEFEVEVLPGRDVAGCRAQAQALLRRLDIPESDLVAGSYSDLVV